MDLNKCSMSKEAQDKLIDKYNIKSQADLTDRINSLHQNHLRLNERLKDLAKTQCS